MIWHAGAPPACPVGSACDGWGCRCGDACSEPFNGPRGYNWGWRGMKDGCGCGRWGGGGFNWLGSVTEIPVERIASFTHNAI